MISCACIRRIQLICVPLMAIPTKLVICLLTHILVFLCSWSSRLSCKMSKSTLDPSSLVWWSALICCVCVFSHSRKISHHLCMLVYQNLQYPSLFHKIWLQYLVVLYPDRSRFKRNKHVFNNHHLDGKIKPSHGYLLYTKCHQGQSQKGVALGPLIISCECVKDHTWILGCLN